MKLINKQITDIKKVIFRERHIEAPEKDQETEAFMQSITAWAAALALVALCFYLVSVFPLLFERDGSATAMMERLGTLGDFFGGVLNPTFAFLALLALLHTLRQNQKELSQATKEMRNTAIAQRDQVEQMRLQSEKEELYKIILSHCAEIDSQLEKQFHITHQTYNTRLIKETTTLSYLTMINKEEIESILLSNATDTHGKTVFHTTSHILRELSLLGSALSIYTNRSQITTVAEHYRVRYLPLIITMTRNNFISLDHHTTCKMFISVIDFFDKDKELFSEHREKANATLAKVKQTLNNKQSA